MPFLSYFITPKGLKEYIPEEADYQVINEAGKHLGQLSDKFVERLKPGDVFCSWRQDPHVPEHKKKPCDSEGCIRNETYGAVLDRRNASTKL